MKKTPSLAITIILLIAVALSVRLMAARSPADFKEARGHCAWVEQCIKRMGTIQPGMTRAQLLKVFTTEGGWSTGLQRTYVLPECPYMKVDVKFTAVGRPERDKDGRVTLIESPKDTIKDISRPYLQWSITD